MPRLPALLILPILAACGSGPSPTAEAPAPQEAAAGADARPDSGAPATGFFDTSRAGSAAPDLPLATGPDGATETLADIRAANPGQPVLVNLWATWCAPCLKELPTLDRLAAETKGRLVVVPISQDREGWRKVTPAFTADRYPNLETRLESGMKFGFEIKARGLPLTILYGADGREIWRYAGDRDWSDAESRARLGV